MYQALYRKWRPQTFDEVIGQRHITDTLKNQVQTGRLSHAYIFIGTRGTGKTTCARILARAVNCEHPVDGNPCGKCAACRGIAEGSVMDVVELDAASNNGVDNVRALREEAVFSPADVKKRVYIIDEVHMLSASAFNALLKILEEPPEHLMFILATTELHKVPATILSRCQRHIFHRIDSPVIADYLMDIASREGFRLEKDAAQLISRLADGGVRDAMSLLDQCSAKEHIDTDAVYSAMGLAGNRRVAQMLYNILKHDAPAVLDEFSGMWMDGKDPAALLSELSSLMRDVLMLQVAPNGGMELISGAYEPKTLKSFAAKMTRDELICALNTVQNAISSLRNVQNPKTAAELCLISLCDNTMGDSVKELKARVSRLERELRELGQNPPDFARNMEEDFSEERPPLPEEPPICYDAAQEPEPFYEEPPHTYTEEPSEQDDLNFNDFREEQPEDAFLEHGSRENMPEKQFSVAGSPADSILWPQICENINGLPVYIKTMLDDRRKVRGRVEGNTLFIDVIPGFSHDSFKKQDILSKFEILATKLSGRQMRVKLGELRQDEIGSRSLDELKNFKEVRFI